jgi:hypothetical protein
LSHLQIDKCSSTHLWVGSKVIGKVLKVRCQVDTQGTKNPDIRSGIRYRIPAHRIPEDSGMPDSGTTVIPENLTGFRKN